MTLFVWKNSKYLKNYGTGQIIAEAETPDEARKLVWGSFEEHLRDRCSWLFCSTQDEDDLEQIEEHRKRLENDLAADPEIMKVVFIEGSE